ncbi:MAG TPA: LrgB family protein [Pseudogracilibacillus sp.]|nr:LrgB family protein [Pseudogracilibacillus sp.]
MGNVGIALLSIIGTIISYIVGRKLFQTFQTPLLLPITVALIIIVTILMLGRITYETYMIGGKWIHLFLGPAVVALAYPLYEQRNLLKRLALPILVGSFVGSIIGVVTGVFLARFARLDEVLMYSLLPKSVTTPVAMDISEALGGIASLAAVLVIIAGLTGALFGPFLFRLFRYRSEVARGVGFGSASHAIGTAQAFERSELEGSSSTIAMIVSAVFVSILTPLFVTIL